MTKNLTLERTYRMEFKATGDGAGGRRTFTGVASSINPDRMNDIVEPKGAKFTLPLPFLYQHDADLPIGKITKAKVTADQIVVEGYVENLPDAPPSLKERLDVAWAEMKSGLIAGLSIGFKPIEYAFIEETDGIRFTSWSWLELSLVTIPANADAQIFTMKSVDRDALRAALGAKATQPVARLSSKTPGVPGKSTHIPEGKEMKTIKEQIEAFQAKRAADVAAMETLMQKATEEGRGLETEESEQYAELEGQVEKTDEHLVRLAKHEKLMLSKATPVRGEPGDADDTGSNRAGGSRPEKPITWGKSNLPPGVAFARYVKCYVAAQGNEMKAAQLAKQYYKDSSPEVEAILRAEANGFNVKTAVAAGTTSDTTWASPLVQYTNMASEFVDFLRPQTLLGRIQGMRRVPFNIRIPRATAGVSAGWVGEGSPKPLSKMAFDSVTMSPYKIAVIVALTDELVRFSNPQADILVRDDMAAAIRQFADTQFLSPGVAGVSGVNPASVSYGTTPITSASAGGTSSVANAYTDIGAALAGVSSNNLDFASLVWVMNPRTALSLSLLRTTQDMMAFEDLNVNGGTLKGIPVITSGNVPYSTSGGSPIFLIAANEILLAEDGGLTIDMSKEASVQMNDAPSAGAQSLVSFWQNNLVGLRAEWYVNWLARRTGAVSYIDSTHY
jgi:HK97 family phage major capsid protein/HK97 family phage prohead protease